MTIEKGGMTKYLSDVLEIDQAVFAKQIARLEQATLAQGIDIRLTASIHHAVTQKITELGLDPLDTTADELYRALHTKALSDNALLLKTLGLDSGATSVQIMQSLVKYVSKRVKKQQIVTIKNKALKKIFTDNVPTRTMKLLHYRSAVSLLKREHPHELYVLAQLLESDSYKKKLQQCLRQLKAADYEEAPLQLLCVDEERWSHIRPAIKNHIVPIFSLPEVGTIAVLPIYTQMTPCLALISAALLFKEVQHLKQTSSYVKVRMLDPSFHHHLETLNEHAQNTLFHISDTPVQWRHVHTLIGRQKLSYDFGPHITKSDMKWFHVEAELAGIDPNLGFWVGTHRLAYAHKSSVVSLHIVDVCFSVMYSQVLGSAPRQFVRRAISDELLQEYMTVPPYIQMVQEQITKIADMNAELMYYEA